MRLRALAFAACALCTSACASHATTSPLPGSGSLDSGERQTTGTSSSFKTYYVDGEGPAGFGGTEIVVFDQSSESIVKRIPVPSPLHVLAFSTDVPHQCLYATAYNPGGGTSPALLTVDTASDTIVNTLPLTGQTILPIGFAIDRAAQYGFTLTETGLWTKGFLTRLNLPLHRDIGTIPTGDNPSHIVADPIRPYMYVFWGSAQVTYIAAINTKTYAIDKLSPITGISGVFDVAMRHDGTRMYLIVDPPYPRFNVRSPVYVVDVATLKVVAQTSVVGGANRIIISPDGSRVFTSSAFLSQVGGTEYVSVSVVNTATNAYVTRFNVEGIGLSSIAMSHDGSRIFVSTCSQHISEPSLINVVDTATLVTTKRVFATDNCLQSAGQFSE